MTEYLLRESAFVIESLLEYIDAIPKEIQFQKAMPGIDRDYVEQILERINGNERANS